MLTFVIPLRAKSTTQNWARFTRIFEGTLASVCNQLNPEYRIIVVCHDVPAALRLDASRVEFVPVDFPLPENNYAAYNRDKWRKLLIGFSRAKSLGSDFIMRVDSDDRVSHHLAGFVERHRDAPGWILKQGYRYRWNSRFIYHEDAYNCGTNTIINAEHLSWPEDRSEAEQIEFVSHHFGHLGVEEHMRGLGAPLAELPFRGGVYVLGHADNLSEIGPYPTVVGGLRFQLGRLRWRNLRQLGNYRLLTAARRAEFSL